MSIKTILLLSISVVIFSSCKGQNNQDTANRNVYNYRSDVAIGDTVSELDKSIWYIFQDRKNNFWFGSDGQGVYRFDGKTIIHFSIKHGLSNNHIRDIQEDKSGNLYFTTLKGINKFDGQKFTLLTVSADNDPNKWKLEADDLWFKAEDGKKGPYRYDGKNLYSLKFPKSGLEDEYYRTYPDSPIDPYALYYIYKDKKGTIWFGTGALGIYRYDGALLSYLYEEHLTLVKKTGGSFGIRSIIEDRKGKFWFCNTKYQYTILPGDSLVNGVSFIRYGKEKGIDISNDPLGDDRIYFQSAAEGNKGDLWLQTYAGGIWRYDGKKTQHYPVRDGVSDAKVITLYQDKTGGLWLGTDGAGVYQFNGRIFEKFSPVKSPSSE